MAPGARNRIAPRPPTVVRLPTIEVRLRGLVRATAIRQGDLAQVRFQYPGSPVGRYMLVPAYKAREWAALGVTQEPRSVSISSGAFQGLRAADAQATNLASIRIRLLERGRPETKSFLVPPEMARAWERTTVEFERVYAEYQKMMAPQTQSPA